MLAMATALPPAAVQASVKVLSDWRGPTVALPDVGFAPDQAPLAVQLVTLSDFHVSELVPPRSTAVGMADNDTEGCPGVTVTATCWLADPPVPEQVSENVAFALRAALTSLPDTLLTPLQAPLAVQPVALALLHVSVVVWPAVSDVGLAPRLTVGAGCATVVEVPPDTVTVTLVVVLYDLLLQVSEYVVLAVSAPVS
jgi:hypothetical protein